MCVFWQGSQDLLRWPGSKESRTSKRPPRRHLADLIKALALSRPAASGNTVSPQMPRMARKQAVSWRLTGTSPRSVRGPSGPLLVLSLLEIIRRLHTASFWIDARGTLMLLNGVPILGPWSSEKGAAGTEWEAPPSTCPGRSLQGSGSRARTSVAEPEKTLLLTPSASWPQDWTGR